ncbi:F-box/LRR-repeat protein At4g14103-like isoform X2 [Lotus japonicus]|uniref:F-box/LRR-repeat protein At4g14103-like isoform X2 n=1 Tax=Lotus japonicus TaxID=34305 RepID=UPI00258257BD|nr:F-box/LRR-repeat protein At4g14103-like isoform X2 [Lotus japonicus]
MTIRIRVSLCFLLCFFLSIQTLLGCNTIDCTAGVMAGLISSSPDTHKLQRSNVGEMKDMISNLPDSLLHYILSLVPTKDAIRTSILAKRWKYLWTCLSVFDFEKDRSFICMKEDQRQKSLYCLLDQVHRLLYHSNCVKKLRVNYFGVAIDADRVNSLISAAVKHKIEELKLYILLKAQFVLPHCLSAFESLNKLVLELGCALNVPSGIHFPGLKRLKLSCVNFANEKSVQHLFSGCPVLQKLTLFNCNWWNIKQVGITIPTLKTLTIFCDRSDREDLLNSKVKIEAVNLLYLSCSTYLIVDFVLVNLASVVDAYIDVGCCYPLCPQISGPRAFKLLSGLGSIKSLRLSTDTLESLSYAKNTLHLLPLFDNLTHLVVDLGNFESTNEALMEILQKTPKLEVLHIPMGFDPQICLDGEDWRLNSVPCCFKYSLKLFSISNFDGSEADIQLLRFLLENARVLGEIRIFCSKTLSADLKKQAEISRLQLVGLGSCVIKFQ